MRTQKLGSGDTAVSSGPRGHDAVEQYRSSNNLPADLQVYDGRDAAGTVEHRDNYFVAVDPDGNIIGRFRELKIAVRALPGRAR
jgi:hypothetical protein